LQTFGAAHTQQVSKAQIWQTLKAQVRA